jgi:hypothetical protein
MVARGFSGTHNEFRLAARPLSGVQDEIFRPDNRYQREVGNVHFWVPTPDPPVNKRDLSTGETGENRAGRNRTKGFNVVSHALLFKPENGRPSVELAKC